MFKKVCSMLFGCVPRIASALIALTALSCSMQANLEEFVEEGISLVKITSSSYSQGVSPNIVANRSVVSGSDVTVNLEILNPEGLALEYEIGCDTLYIDGGAIPTIDPTGPGQDSVSFTFTPLPAATGNTITFTIAIRSPSLNKVVERGIVSIRCVDASNTDIRLQAILGSQNVTYAFSSTGQTSAIMDLTTASTLTFIPTAEVSGQSFAFNLEAGGSSLASGLLISGSQTDLLPANNSTNILTITVTPPIGASQNYTIKVPRGGFTVIPGGNYTVAAFQAAINSHNHIKLGGDITLTDDTDGPIISSGDANFYFDGNGHKIRNMTINATGDASFIGTNSGIIKNLSLENVNITSTSGMPYVAGLVGTNNGTIYRCSVSGKIIADGPSVDPTTGGLVAYVDNGSSYIAECYTTADVKGKFIVGGLVGYAPGGTILNCYARGHVDGDDEVGGLVGSVGISSIVGNSYATDSAFDTLFHTGLGKITYCYYGPAAIPGSGSWNYTTTLNPAYVWGIGSGINEGYPYLQYFGAQTMLPP